MTWQRIGWLAALLLASAVATTAPAQAQEAGAQERSAARTLAQQGDAAWDKGDYETALDKFERAHALVKAPTLALRQAECLEKLGRLVDASEKYLEISRVTLDAGAPVAFKRAVETAGERAASVRARLATLTVVVSGQSTEGAKLTVDGKEVPTALWGTGFPTDPGWHDVALTKGTRSVQTRVNLQEKGAQTVTLELPAPKEEPAADPEAAAPEPAPPPPEPVAPAPAGPAPAAAPVAADTTDSSQATWGWVGIAVGGAGLVTGAITAVMLTSQKGELDESCQEGFCPATESEEVDSFNQLRPIPTIGFAVGAVGLGAGLYLLFTAPEPNEQQSGVRPWVGLGQAGVRGRF